MEVCDLERRLHADKTPAQCSGVAGGTHNLLDMQKRFRRAP